MKQKIIFTIFILFLFLSLSPNIVIADSKKCPTGQTCLDNPLGKDNPNPQQLIGKIIKAVLGIVGSLSLVMFIYGGFIWMTSSGNAESVTKGKNTLIWATLGLVVIFSAYAILRFVFTELGVA
ncbi:MAG: pilin [Candidatus Falkowbacteria bacterium]